MLSSFANQAQALGFTLSEVKWKKFAYACRSTLKSITLWVKVAAFASGVNWGGSIHTWLVRPCDVLDKSFWNLCDHASWNDFFSPLSVCDFKMAGGSESISETLTSDASGNQQLVNLNSDIEERFMYK